ncbi:MAG: hypothetical protein ACI8PZ_004645 [Myxococcota bacterium]|jgi:hypothetical protein
MRALWPLVMLTACSEIGVSNFNNEPEAQITSHSDGDVVRFDTLVQLRGSASDPDGRVDELVVAWIVDGAQVCDGAEPDDRGLTTCEHVFPKDTEGRVALEVTDGRASTAVDRIDLEIIEVVGNPPNVTFVEPSSGSEAGFGEPVVFLAVVTDVEDVANELALSWASDADGEFSTQGPDSGGTATFVYNGLSPGSHTVSLDVTDSDGNVATALTTLTIAEANAPVVEFVEVLPSPAYTDEILEAAAVATDPDGDPIEIAIDWYVDGVEVGAIGNTLDGARWFDKGQTVYAVVTANDGTSDSLPAISEVVEILNSPPTAPDLVILPDAPAAGVDDLLCAIDLPAEDADGDVFDYRIGWTVDGADYPRPSDIGPRTTTWTGDTVPAEDLALGENWVCTVVATDGEDDGPDAQDSITIGEAPVDIDYNGNFGLEPPIHYDCQLTFIFVRDVVNFDISTLIFVDSGAALTVTGAPTAMRQVPVPVDENFAASGVIAGGCNETYSVSGTFSDEDNWSGLLQLSFTGPECGLTNCTNQVWPVSGTRL